MESVNAENVAAEAFASETGTVPVVNVSGVDAPTVTTNTASANTKFYTEEDLAKVRSQEKDKLYPQIETLKEEIQAIKREKEEQAARIAAEAKAEAEKAAADAKAKFEAELEAKDLIKLTQSELQEQLDRERQERERAFALLEQERAYAEFQNYRTARIDAERESIIPELVDLISGNTQEEIEASIEALKDRSNRILESVAQASQSARREMVGTRATLPASGPMDINTGNRQFTADEIAAMPMNEYAKYRQNLLSESARGTTKGLFG